MRPIYPALATVLAAVALAAPPTHAGPINAVIPAAAGGYHDAPRAQTRVVIPDAAGGYYDTRRTSRVIPDAAGGYDDGHTPPVLGVPPLPGDAEPSGDGLPWEVLAAGLAGGTLVLTTTGVVAGRRRRTFRALTAA